MNTIISELVESKQLCCIYATGVDVGKYWGGRLIEYVRG